MWPASAPIDLQQRHALLHQFGAFDDGVGHVLHLRRERGHVEQPDRLGGLLHLVDGVVHRGDQVADVAAVERRDEGAPHRDQHVARDIVGVLLAIHHRLVVAGDRVAAFEHGAQRHGARHHRVRMLREQLEEALFLRHQGVEPTQHGDLACRLRRRKHQKQRSDRLKDGNHRRKRAHARIARPAERQIIIGRACAAQEFARAYPHLVESAALSDARATPSARSAHRPCCRSGWRIGIDVARDQHPAVERHDLAILRAGGAVRPDVVLAVRAALEPQFRRLRSSARCIMTPPPGPLAIT